MQYEYDKVALASCDHQKSKLQAVAGAEGFCVAELWVRQLKIGGKSCFEKLNKKLEGKQAINLVGPIW